MNFGKRISAIFQSLRLTKKAQSKGLTAADWKAIRNEYKKKYGTELDADQKAYEASKKNAQKQKAQAQNLKKENDAVLNIALKALDKGNSKNGGAKRNSSKKPQTPTQAVTALANTLTGMMSQMLPDTPHQVEGGVQLNINGPGNNPKYFLGIPHSMFSMDRRWSKVSANPAYALTNPVDEKKDGPKFREAFSMFADKVARRINYHRKNNTLNFKALSESDGIDVNLSGNGGLGDQFVTIRIDALIARLLAIKNVFDIFPRRFGVQDRELMTNAFFGEFSQSYQEGAVWKGNIDLEPEVCYVDDAMMKTLFKSLKWMERQYIGYLNSEGSDPIKWSMIEWAMLNISTKLIREQNERKILGIYIKPEEKKAGHYLNAGTGVFYTVLRYYNEGKIALLDNPAYASYTSGTTMVGLVKAMYLELASKVDSFDTEYEVILNDNHRAMWKEGIRAVYGKDTDFKGTDGQDVIPDTNINITWCPHFGKLPIVLFQMPGNIQSIENEPGEMHGFSFETEMENVKVWSVWKEGTAASFAGREFKTKALCAANDFAEQQIFMNKPSVTIDVDATVVTVQGDQRIYVTGENTTVNAITDIVGAKQGVAYMIEAGGANPQKVAKAGKFDTITEEFVPVKPGDYILVAAKDKACTKFYELERCVDEIRTINKEVQPNVPGAGGR